MKAMLHPQGLRPRVANWDAIAPLLIRRVHREALTAGEDSFSQVLFQELLRYPDVADCWHQKTTEIWQAPILTVEFSKDQQTLSFFSTIATLGDALRHHATRTEN